MYDGEAFGAEMVDIVKGYLERNLTPVLARLEALEKRLADMPVPVNGKDGEPGKSVTIDDVAPLIAAEVTKAVAAIPAAKDGEPGKDADLTVVKAMIEEAVSSIPEPVNGKDADPQVIKSMVQEAIAALPVPQDGKSVELDDVRPLVEEAVTKAVSALPKPKDGEPGKDGIGLAGALIDRSGNLVVTTTNGAKQELGPIVGKDGEPGSPGADGSNGKDGRDGFGFDDMDLVETESGLFLKFVRGDETKSFRLPVPLDRGVFKEGAEYHRGDFVTWGGSGWIAQDATNEKPDTGKGWRLAIKKGRDGKDGIMRAPAKNQLVRIGTS